MPKFHTDVFWDLGKEVSLTDTFTSQQKGIDHFRDKVMQRNQNTIVQNSNDISTNASIAGGSHDNPKEQVEKETEQI